MPAPTPTQPDRPGLARNLSPLAAWGQALGCVVGWGIMTMPGDSFLPEAGPLGTAIALGVGALLTCVIATSYGNMARRYPSAGGVYSYARAAFGANHAFVCSWTLVLVYTAAIAANATALGIMLRGVVGQLRNADPSYVVAGYSVHAYEVTLALLAIGCATWICSRGVRMAGNVQTVLAIAICVATLVLAALAATHVNTTPGALSPPFPTRTNAGLGILNVAMITPWAFAGFESVSQLSEECRFSTRRFGLIMQLAIVAGGLVYIAVSVCTAAATPPEYASWEQYIQAAPQLMGVRSLPSFSMGSVLAGDAGLALVLVIAVGASLTGVLGFMLALSRLIYSMAQDGALSKRLARFDERHHVPIAATLAIAAAAIVIPFFGQTVLGWIVDLMTLGVLVAYCYTCAARLHFARMDHDRAGQLLGACGIALSIGVALLLFIPGVSKDLSVESYVVLIAWIVIGINFYTPTRLRGFLARTRD